MRVWIYCKGHKEARVRILEATTKYWFNGQYVTEASEEADTVELDESNFYCHGDVAKAAHEFGYIVTM